MLVCLMVVWVMVVVSWLGGMVVRLFLNVLMVVCVLDRMMIFCDMICFFFEFVGRLDCVVVV